VVDGLVTGAPVAVVLPLVAVAGALLAPKLSAPPVTPVRYAYGGTHCAGDGAGGSQAFTWVPPSTRRAGPTHTLFETLVGAAHVHIEDGQSALVLQRMVLTWHDEVESVVVVQVGAVATLASPAPVGGGVEGADPGTELPTVADPAEPEPVHSVAVSGTQVKPDPQSESILHGTSYCGTHDFELMVVHAPASKAGTAQSAFGGQAGLDMAGQLSTESVKQTMPVAQSAFVLHGPGWHCLMTWGLQTGVVQVAPLAHAMAGQADAPTT
jgi:hypothetical protein